MSTRIRFHFASVLVPMILFAAAACNLQTPTGTSTAAGQASQAPGSGSTAQAGTAPVDLPTARLDEAGDVNSIQNAHKKLVSGGDIYISGLFERPFNANTMDTYFPYVDIIDAQGFLDDTWGYASITVANNDKNGALPGQYAVELDLNKDGRGDWLILAKSVSGTTWSTSGVQAYKDTDGDVGGVSIMSADKNVSVGDGYETLVFDQGKGSLPDGAWARVSPNDPKTVELAFKLSMLGNPSGYAMGAWTGTNIDPKLFDYEDHMTHAQAGSPNPGDTIYPIKQMAEIDNTCRLAIGFAPTGKEPGLCATVAKREGGGGACVPRGCPLAALSAGCVPVTCP